jgi:hypothetical protein
MTMVEAPSPQDPPSTDPSEERARELHAERDEFALAIKIAVLEATIFTC